MPDWSYRTVFRPILFQLPLATARNLALGSLGTLASLPFGGPVIDLLGHMRPHSRLRTRLGPLELASPVVIGPHLDQGLQAPRALSRFGVGMIEIGPIAKEPSAELHSIARDDATSSLRVPFDHSSQTPASAAILLDALRPAAPLLLRLSHDVSDADVAYLAPYCAAFAVELDALERSHLASAVQAAQRPLFVVAAADQRSMLPAALVRAVAAGAVGIVIDGRIRDPSGDRWLIGGAALDDALAAVQIVRESHGSALAIIAGGAIEPGGAIRLLKAGADAVQVDAGLVYSGPGLCKRINEAVLFARAPRSRNEPIAESPHDSIAGDQPHAAAMSWLWGLLLGIAMLIGGGLALAIAATRVLLPYDEQYLGMTAVELQAINPRLVHFMEHDRVTLAGTMLTVGIQFIMLAWFGIRRGLHWAKMTLLASAFSGFFTFFLFLGFGYFDPFHAFVTAINFQFVLLALQGRLGAAAVPEYPGLADDWRWRLAQWGTLLLLVEAAAVIVAGLTICAVGSTSVFVAEDLEFMGTTAEALRQANPRLVPVIAHDRASFGGMLLAAGLVTLLAALWGIRPGATWLWWMFALSGTIGYAVTLLVHVRVGYIDAAHLAPAIGGLALLWAALSLLFPFMKPATPRDIAEWDELRAVS